MMSFQYFHCCSTSEKKTPPYLLIAGPIVIIKVNVIFTSHTIMCLKQDRGVSRRGAGQVVGCREHAVSAQYIGRGCFQRRVVRCRRVRWYNRIGHGGKIQPRYSLCVEHCYCISQMCNHSSVVHPLPFHYTRVLNSVK